jgi:hypothetical protein
VTRAIATSDVFGDGHLDFVVANQWGRSTFYRNTAEVAPYLGLRLRVPVTVGPSGERLTRPAIGAEIEVTRTDGRVLRRQVYPANGHTGMSSPDLLFGLGSSPPGPVKARIRYRDGGGVHEWTAALAPGWHTIVLDPRTTRT